MKENGINFENLNRSIPIIHDMISVSNLIQVKKMVNI